MITQEKFDAIVKQIIAGEAVSAEDATELVQTIAELEQRTNVAQEVVEFVLHGAEQVYRETAERVVRQLNLRDHAKVKRVLKIGEEAATRLTTAAQVYIAQVYLRSQEESGAGVAEDGVSGGAVHDLDEGLLVEGDTA